MNPQMQANYRQPFPQAQGRSPAARRPGQMPAAGPHPQAHSVINQQHIQQQREIQMQHQLAQRRSKKPTDLNMPEGIEDVNPVIGELVGMYKALQEAERKLDMTMMRKRLDMQDTFNRHIRREQSLRIFISNTVENQPWQQDLAPDSFNFETGEDSTYKMKVVGELLKDDDDEEDENDVEEDETQKSRKRFFHFFKAVSVDVERPFGEPVNLVDWKKQPNQEIHNHFTMERKGDENLNVVISLTRDESPERYRLSQALSQTLDMEEGDRAEVLQGVWEYVKFMGLQEDEEKRKVRCDAALKQIFGVDVVYFPQIPERIIPHLHPLPPVKLRYTIRMDPEYKGEWTIYDVRVAVDDPIRARIYRTTHNPKYHDTLRQINAINDQLAVMIQELHHRMARHAFFSAFAKDPVNFIKKWLSSQQRDLDIILGERGEKSGGMEFEKGGPDGVWNSDLVHEAVRYMLNKNPQG